MYERFADCHPKLRRGIVWCTICGRSQRVNSAECFRSGWPECCGYTMTIDSPSEREALDRERVENINNAAYEGRL
jgi:hypothetical protein